MISDAININGHRYVLREDYDVLAARCAALEKAIRDANTALECGEGVTLEYYMDGGFGLTSFKDSAAVIYACLASADGAQHE